MLDMGFGPEIKKIVEDFGMPPKTDRQTLMFSATFPEEIQRLAALYLNDYLFLSVGVVGGANSDVSQHLFEVDRVKKREQLVSILTESGKGMMSVKNVEPCPAKTLCRLSSASIMKPKQLACCLHFILISS